MVLVVVWVVVVIVVAAEALMDAETVDLIATHSKSSETDEDADILKRHDL